MELFNLFIAFLIPGIIGYGGGPGSITIIAEQVEKYNFMDSNSFNELIGICNALPGPIATKLAGAVGYEVYGITGLLVSILSIMLPSILAILLLLKILTKNKDNPKVKRLSKYLMPIIIVLFIKILIKFFWQSFPIELGQPFSFKEIIHPTLLLIFAIISFIKLKLHPLIVICTAMAYGFLITLI